MATIALARYKMCQVTAELRISRAIHSKLPPTTNFPYELGESVRVYTENDSTCCSPVRVIQTRSNEVTDTDSKTIRTYGVS